MPKFDVEMTVTIEAKSLDEAVSIAHGIADLLEMLHGHVVYLGETTETQDLDTRVVLPSE